MPTKGLFESSRVIAPASIRCPVCSDSGFVFFVERKIVGIKDFLENSAPCTCVAGDQWREEYEFR